MVESPKGLGCSGYIPWPGRSRAGRRSAVDLLLAGCRNAAQPRERIRAMKALYYGDNLQVLRDSIGTESVDLIYLDPPFNSNATYNVLFRSPKG